MNNLWNTIVDEAQQASRDEGSLASFYYAHVLAYSRLRDSLSFTLAERLGSSIVPATTVRDVIVEAYDASPCIVESAEADLRAIYERDPACDAYVKPLLFFKGFHALQAHRVANFLWRRDRKPLALYIQSLVSERFHVDIHPAATLGRGIMLDHATGIVIGETAEIGDDVSILHAVTLGGSGCAHEKRHPTVKSGVLIATGAKLLGPIVIGEAAKIAAGSVVTVDVPAHTTVVGVPARIIGKDMMATPAHNMEQNI